MYKWKPLPTACFVRDLIDGLSTLLQNTFMVVTIQNIRQLLLKAIKFSTIKNNSYVTEFAKTDLMGTNAEIHFLPVDEGHIHALSRDTKHLRLDGRVCFFRRLFPDAVKPRGCISWPVWPLRGTNKTAWGAKRILTAGLAYPVGCASLGHLLTARHCHLCLSACFGPPSASHPPPPPTHPL